MHRANLILHCGARSVTRDRIAATATPARTRTWVPIPHARLLEGVQSNLEGAGMSVVTEAHALTHDGARYFGLLQLANDHDDTDHGLVVGLRNSHDQQFPAGLAVGAAVFICDNLSFSSEVTLARKHTAHVQRDLPALIERAVGRLGDLRRSQEERFARYKTHELSDGQAHDLVIQALDAGVVPVTKIPDVLAEWRQPRHAEFRDGRTAWRLFNGFTEALKGRLDALPRRTQALHGLLDTTCGLTVERN